MMNPLILVVEDEIALRFGMSIHLRREGFDVVEAGCIAEARENLSRQSFDGVLLDSSLPDGDGIDCIGEFKMRYPQLAVIVLTGLSNREVHAKALHYGADATLLKPVIMQELTAMLQPRITANRRLPESKSQLPTCSP